MVDLARFTMADMAQCGVMLRNVGKDAASMEEAAAQIVRYLYDEFRDPVQGERGFALVRCYKTHAYGALPDALQTFARTLISATQVEPTTQCLTLLATAGDEAAWNSRHSSAGHQAIPLASPGFVARLPMVAQLIAQFGLNVEDLIAHNPMQLLEMQQRTFNVFFVPEAVGSPSVPAQESFVVPYRIRSVIGFGGLLPSGDLFAIIGFARTAVARETAELFKPLALNVKLALLPFDEVAVFAV